ncbi:dTDP-4-dehydrorhamnose reductase [Terriglobus tenax]|uniref:dTDP-4-dehydrorhamnose reductase n=1 Tax=Terriglobus tenax TaxID=1111115 RepID=UPI0021DF4355|nr:dTDP-4-dehydrorhamnose reductase [Terriglobus tenax]
MGPVLLTGASGQVGGELEPMLKSIGGVIAPRREELDLSDLDAVRHAIRSLKPRWIINPAAYTSVDKAEQEPNAAYRLNAELPGVLGEEAAALGAVVLHFSTDYVFAGEGNTPYVESDETGPMGVYGASKLAGEHALAATGAAHFIFRTSWVYNATGKNFLRTILRFAREREELKIVADQHGAPTWARDLARLAIHTVESCESAGNAEEKAAEFSGVYHSCNAGETTWYGFAQEFLSLAAAKEPTQHWATLIPIRTTEYLTPARRPANSRLNCSKLEKKLNFRMPLWQDSLRRVMAEL